MVQLRLKSDLNPALAVEWTALTASLAGQEASLAAKAWDLASADPEAGAELQLGLRVATVLAGLDSDTQTLAAGLLLPQLEAQRLEGRSLAQTLSPELATLVQDAARLSVMSAYREAADAQADKLRKMLLSMAQDPRAVIIRLAERLARLRACRQMPFERRLVEEAIELHAPLAGRLGIWQLKWELEDLAFRHLDPDAYQRIAGWLDERRAEREDYIQRVVAQVYRVLAEAGVKAEVSGRAKHIYSIWSKMRRKELAPQQLRDLLALRILVDEVSQCYAALGLVHGMWRQIPEEFDDYIGRPKPNLYRSLHTAVIGPEERTLEVQIRTHEMHRHAELGVAAHWRYKDGRTGQARESERIAWFKGLLDRGPDVPDGAADLIARVSARTFRERIYVVTPQGRVVDLPLGATPLDFAYAVHTELGHRCRGAKVDGAMVPLAYTLQSGQQVEILAARSGTPSRDWLNPALGYLRSAGARAKVKRWFKEQDRDQHVALGRALIEREQRRTGVTDVNLAVLARRFAQRQVEDLFAALGRGDLSPVQIDQALRETLPKREQIAAPVPATPTPTRRARGALEVLGISNLLTRIAGCCRPVPDDPIAGYITQTQGVTVHRQNCPSLLRLAARQPQRLIDIAWGTSSGDTYPTEILVEAVDRRGLLRDVSDAVASADVNIVAINTVSDRNTHTARMSITVEIASAQELDRVFNRIARISGVLYARRRL